MLNVFQSVTERAPVVVVLASARESPVPVIESPFGVPEINPSLLLNIVQSMPVSAPVVLILAFMIPNSPVPLLYVSGPLTESEVRLILELNVFQSATESDPVVLTDARPRESCCPERESPFGVPSVTAS